MGTGRAGGEVWSWAWAPSPGSLAAIPHLPLPDTHMHHPGLLLALHPFLGRRPTCGCVSMLLEEMATTLTPLA